MTLGTIDRRKSLAVSAARRRRCARALTRPAFTLTELLVSVGIVALAVLTLAEIFSISSETAGRTAAHAGLLAASASFEQQAADQLDRIVPGLLVIDSPSPTQARSEVPGAPRLFRLRHDRLLFVAAGAPGEYQSFTDPTRGIPGNVTDENMHTASTAEALVFLGPGAPLSISGTPRYVDDIGNPDSVQMTASEWVFAHRQILLMLERPTNSDPNWGPPDMTVFTSGGGMLNGGPLADAYAEGVDDAVVSSGGTRADASTLIRLIQQIPINDLLIQSPEIRGLLQSNWAPKSVSLADPTAEDYYLRGGFNFLPGLADFRIEWTDGRMVNPPSDPRTRWFGLRPDPTQSPNIGSPDDVSYIAVRRSAVTDNTTQAEIDLFADRIEWWTDNGSPDAAYRAVWRTDTWAYRPRALRFTYRIFDSLHRMERNGVIDADEDGYPEPEGGAPGLIVRYGQEFSIVVPLP